MALKIVNGFKYLMATRGVVSRSLLEGELDGDRLIEEDRSQLYNRVCYKTKLSDFGPAIYLWVKSKEKKGAYRNLELPELNRLKINYIAKVDSLIVAWIKVIILSVIALFLTKDFNTDFSGIIYSIIIIGTLIITGLLSNLNSRYELVYRIY